MIGNILIILIGSFLPYAMIKCIELVLTKRYLKVERKMENHQQILSLIEDTQAFTLLHNHFNRFNPFKVLNVDNYEIRHSNVLAWLLDPKGNHDLGSHFINKLIAKVFVNPDNLEEEDKLGNYDVLKLSRNNYHDLIVHKELATTSKKRIDLLAISPINKVAVLIENKYWSSESEGQLEEYIEYTRSAYAAYKVIPIYLTLQDGAPTHTDYLMLGYSDVLDILKNLIDSNKDYMNAQVHSFISYYIDILEDQLVQNNELNEIGINLYKNHKEAIESLYAIGKEQVKTADDEVKQIYFHYKDTIDFIKKVSDSILKEAFIRFTHNLGWSEHLSTPDFRVPNFIEQKWYESFKEEDLRQKWWMNKGLIAWFEQADRKLKLRLEVGPLQQEKRVLLLKALRNTGVEIREQALEEGRKYTRIYMDADIPSSWEDVDSLVDSMSRLYNKESFQSLLTLISTAIDMDKAEIEAEEIKPTNKSSTIEQAFMAFVAKQQIVPEFYNMNKSLPSFVTPEWTEFPESYQVTEKYWLGYPLIAWFRRRNSTVRLIVEVGPLAFEQRTRLLKHLEQHGIPIRALAYEEGRRFTRIYSRFVPVNDMEDPVELEMAMEKLMADSNYKETRNRIGRAVADLHKDVDMA